MPIMPTSDRDRVRRITSRQNSLVKDLRRAFHQAELVDGHCAIEGVRVIEEAIRSGLRFRAVFFSEGSVNRAERLLPQISNSAEALELPDDIFASAVATESSQGVAALVRWPEFPLERVLQQEKPLLLGTLGLQDPGNLGTIIRSAEAFGASAVLLGEKTVSEFNAKVIRASAGSSFRLPTPHITLTSVQELKKNNVRILATSSHKGDPIDTADMSGAVAILVGSEGAGVPREYMNLADEFI